MEANRLVGSSQISVIKEEFDLVRFRELLSMRLPLEQIETNVIMNSDVSRNVRQYYVKINSDISVEIS
jgi:hypothetical protein